MAYDLRHFMEEKQKNVSAAPLENSASRATKARESGAGSFNSKTGKKKKKHKSEVIVLTRLVLTGNVLKKKNMYTYSNCTRWPNDPTATKTTATSSHGRLTPTKTSTR